MLLFISKYITVNYLEVQYLMHFDLSKHVDELSENDLKAHFLLFFDKMIKRKARLFLVNTEKCNIHENFVDWFDSTILPLVKSVKATKIAWVGVNNQIKDKADLNIAQKNFNDNASAMKWLLENAERKKLSFENGNKPPSHHHHHKKD